MNGVLTQVLIKNKNSLSTFFRMKRMEVFKSLLSTLPLPVKVLDVGGTAAIWEYGGFGNQDGILITIMNLKKPTVNCENMIAIAGDARCMQQFGNQEFDVVFSNSVIEHVGDFKHQIQMAEEIKRVGKRYIIQTPNYFFPLEPHFLFPFFQFFPLWFKLWLTKNFNLGNRKKATTEAQAIANVVSIRLLTKKEMVELFPEAVIQEEKFLGLTKSFVAIGGWNLEQSTAKQLQHT